MDGQVRKKALFRAKMKEHERKLDKRITSPLVRYNESDQPVCRVCDVVLKSESFWQAHQVSRKHHEAINKIKADAAGRTQVDNIKPKLPLELPKSEAEGGMHFGNTKHQPSAELCKTSPISELPANFFDNQEQKRPKTGLAQNPRMKPVVSEKKSDQLPSNNFANTESNGGQLTVELMKKIVDSENNGVKGALPEGFFDDKDADLRARGIQPVKPDVKDEYKEFEKSIQEDLKEVDDRLEEEEFDAAETIEEAESLEQKGYREKVEMMKKKKLELKAAQCASYGRVSEVKKASKEEESSSDDDIDEDFTVDWRAKHL